MKDYEYYMKHALQEAYKAFDADEVPIGAVIVNQEGEIIAQGFNKTEQYCTQVAHAEMEALQQAGKYNHDWRLQGCTLYVTLQPCSMCYNAAVLSRISTIVYGAPSPLFGFHLDKDAFLSVYNKDKLFIVKGILEFECVDLLKKFFRQKRKDE